MVKKLTLLLALAAANAWSAPERNIAVDIDAPGAVRADVTISIPSLKPTRVQLQVVDGALAGGIYLPPGKENLVSITAVDARGEKLYTGSGYVAVRDGLTPQVDIPLAGKSKEPLTAKFGTYRLALGLAAGPTESGLLVQTTLIDAMGNHLPIKPEDLDWRGWPDKFELLPYSCFRESLCIELPDPKASELIVACMRDFVCSHQKPKDTRGPYWYVATGRMHTCALTATSEIRCWGDNRYGQLRATPSACPASANTTWPSDCSLVPLPIQCGPGEVCRFQSLAAGGERTCAVDTTGRLWCWGSNADASTDEPAPLSYADRFNGEVEAFTANHSKVSFLSVDTDLRTTCAITSTHALYCWDFNQSLLDDRDIHSPGTQYASVSVGKAHVCARQLTGKFECWGAGFDGQLDGTITGSAGPNANLQQILTRGGHRPAAGATSTCAQDPDDNTICWGSPSHWVGATNATGGWMALRQSYATSLASNADQCLVSGNSFECTRICATGLAGDLFCGNWKFWATPTQLPVVPDPPSDHYVLWNQVDVSPNHVCGVTSQRDIWCFGTNAFGQLGTGTSSTARTDAPTTAVIR